MIQRDDPLYGVLSDEQVGLDAATGRRKISPEVLQNMREYILSAEGGEKRVREERVRNSVLELRDDPIGQRNFLRLEAPPVVTSDVDIDKGRTFGYGPKYVESQLALRRSDGISINKVVDSDPQVAQYVPSRGKAIDLGSNLDVFECSTSFSSGYIDANSSETSKLKGGRRYRPPKRMRRFKSRSLGAERDGEKGKENEDNVVNVSVKRRAEAVAGEFARVARRSKPEVVPNGGLPNQ